MLKWLCTYVSSVCFKCLICIIHMLQVFSSECYIYMHVTSSGSTAPRRRATPPTSSPSSMAGQGCSTLSPLHPPTLTARRSSAPTLRGVRPHRQPGVRRLDLLWSGQWQKCVDAALTRAADQCRAGRRCRVARGSRSPAAAARR
jgi:hypothetical protein